MTISAKAREGAARFHQTRPRYPGDRTAEIGYARFAGNRDGTRDGLAGLPRDALRGEGAYGKAYDAAYRDAKAGR